MTKVLTTTLACSVHLEGDEILTFTPQSDVYVKWGGGKAPKTFPLRADRMSGPREITHRQCAQNAEKENKFTRSSGRVQNVLY